MSTTPPDINLGPLTTTFTAPSGCFTISITTHSSGEEPGTFAALHMPASCYPSGKPLGSDYTKSTLDSYRYHDEHIFFSPGECPVGWAQYPATTDTTNSAIYTTAFCCPMGFHSKTTTLASSETVWKCVTSNNYPTTLSSYIFSNGIGDLLADPVFIKYQLEDFLSSTSSTSSPTAFTTTRTSQSSTPAQTPSAATGVTVSTPEPKQGLSTGAKIGIGIGIPFSIIFIAIACACIALRRRKQEVNSPLNNPGQDFVIPHYYLADNKAELPSNSSVVQKSTPEEDLFNSRRFVQGNASELDISPANSPISPASRQEFMGYLHTPRTPTRDEELEYQERRLRERREILAEKERLAREEDELRRLKGSHLSLGVLGTG